MQGGTTSRAASSEDSEGARSSRTLEVEREGKRPRGPPAAPRSPRSGCSAAPGSRGRMGHFLSRAGGGGLLSLTHWAGSPRCPSSTSPSPPGQGYHGGQQQWEQGPHTTFTTILPAPLDGPKLFPCGRKKQLTVRLLARLTPQSLSKKEN